MGSYPFPPISSRHPSGPFPQHESLSLNPYNRDNTYLHPHDFIPPPLPIPPLPSSLRSSSPPSKSSQKRPSSTVELTQRAKDYTFYPAQSLKSLANDAEQFNKLAKKQHAQGDYEEAFINYIKAATIFREKLPQHRDYHTFLSGTQRSTIRGSGQAILDALSELELKLAYQYERWQTTTMTTAPSITNAPRLPHKSLPPLSSTIAFPSPPPEWGMKDSRAKDEEYLQPRVPQEDRSMHLRSKSTSQLPPDFARDSYTTADSSSSKSSSAFQWNGVPTIYAPALSPTNPSFSSVSQALKGSDNNLDFLTSSYIATKTTSTQIDQTIFGVKNLTDKIRISYNEKLGTGGFSEVFKASYTTKEDVTQAVAVKKLTITNIKSKSNADGASRLKKRLAREVRVWRSLVHANIVPLLGVYMAQSDIFPGMVMPLYRHGSASHYLGTREFSTFEKFTLLYEIACGLSYLHAYRPPIVHGDLKAQNVLIDNEEHAVLSDFGISRILEKTLEPTGTTTSGPVEASLRWSAPEVILNDEPARFTPASDVWSFGCTGYEIITGEIPYYQYSRAGAVVARILKGEVPTWPATTQQNNETSDKHEGIPSSVTYFIDSLWKADPEERGEMTDIMTGMQSMLRFVDDKVHY